MPFDGKDFKIEPATVADVLIRARELIASPKRWCQGTEEDEEGRMCLRGAIINSGHTDFSPILEARRLVERYTGGNITAFNDAPYRTHADVVAMLDRCIKIARSYRR